MNAGTKPQTGFDQLVCVVAVRAANDHNHVALFCKFNGRVLPLLRRLADGVNEAHLRFWKTLADQLRQPPDFFDRLRRLRDDAET